MAFDSNLLLALYFLLLAMTVVMYTTWRYNKDIRGLRDWLVGYLAALANLTQFLWNPLHSELALVLCNQTTLMATGYFAMRGCCRHMNLRCRLDLFAIALMAADLCIATYFTVVLDKLGVRFFVSSFVSGLFCVIGGVMLSREGYHSFPLRHLFGWTLTAHGLFNALRALLFAKDIEPTLQSLSISPTNLILYEQIVVTPLLALGAVLLTNEVISSKLRSHADHDALTSLYNRRKFLELLTTCKGLAARSGMPMSLLVLDLDHFKSINDNYGHLAGDQVLAGFARRMEDSLRREDVMGRLGGEEFAIFLPNTPLDVAIALAERLRSIAESQAVSTDKGPVSYTVSIGATSIVPGESVEQSIDRADAALYEAKRSGRNRSVSRSGPASSSPSMATMRAHLSPEVAAR